MSSEIVFSNSPTVGPQTPGSPSTPLQSWQHFAIAEGRGRINLEIYYESERMVCKIVEAKELSYDETIEFRNLYVKIKFSPDNDDSRKAKTRALVENSNPAWNEVLTLPIVSSEDRQRRLLIIVCDGDKLVGCTSFAVSKIMRSRVKGWYQLLKEESGIFHNLPVIRATGELTDYVNQLKDMADDYKTQLTRTQTDLDLANDENGSLIQEVKTQKYEIAKLQSEIVQLKQNLSMLQESIAPEDESQVDFLNQRIAKLLDENKDLEKYIDNVTGELRNANDLITGLERRNASIQEKLKNCSAEKESLTVQVGELQAKLCQCENQIAESATVIRDLQQEIMELRAMSSSAKSRRCRIFGDRSTPVVDGGSIGDISVDDPMSSPSKEVATSEVIGDYLVLDLQENLSKITQELDTVKEKRFAELEENEKLKEKISALEDGISTKEAEHRNLLQNLEQKCVHFENYARGKEAELSECHAEIAKQKFESENEKKLLREESNAKVSHLEQMLSSKEEIVRENEARLKQLQSEKLQLEQSLQVSRDRLEFETNEKSNLVDSLRQVKDELRESFLKINSLNETLDEARRQIEFLNVEKEELRAQMKREIDEQSSVFNMQINDLTASRDAAQLEIQLKIEEINTCRAALDSKNHDLECLRDEVEQGKFKLETLAHELANEKSKLSNTLRVKEALDDEFQTKCREVLQLSGSLEEAKKDLETLQENGARSVKDLRQEHADEVVKMHEEKTRIVEQLRMELFEKTKEFEDHMAECKQRRNEDDLELQSLREHLIKSREAFEQKSNELLQLSSSLTQKSTALDEKCAEAEKEKEKFAQKEIELLALIRENETLFEEEKRSLRDKFEAGLQEIAAMNESIKKMSEANQDLLSENEKIKKLSQETHCEVENYQAKIEMLQKDYDARVKQKEAEYQQLEELLAQQSDEKLTIRQELERANEEHQLKIKSLQNQIEVMTSEENIASGERNSIISSLETELLNLKNEKIARNKELEQMEHQVRAVIQEKEERDAEISEVKSEVVRLQDLLEREKAESLKIREEMTSLHEEQKQDLVRTYEQQLQELSKKLSENLSEVARLTNELSNAERKLINTESLSEKCDSFEKQVVALETEKSNVKVRLEEAETIILRQTRDIETMSSSLEDKTGQFTQLKEKLSAEKDSALQAQKKRYEERLSQIKEIASKQYRTKLEECHESFKKEMKEKEAKLEQFRKQLKACEDEKAEMSKSAKISEEKYSISKKKIAEMVTKMEEVITLTNKEKEEILNKYKQAKESLRDSRIEIEKLQGQSEDQHLRSENEKLKRELQQAKTELRSLKVQSIYADTKLRELQQIDRRQSARYESCHDSSSRTDSDGFKLPPTAKPANTPGRAKAGRTQSEVSIRRPPAGAGSLFFTDEEAGEMFSNSYLTDLKEGKCAMAKSSDRISELARRNSMVPFHLKSSYPVETQFRPQKEFSDDALRFSNLPPNADDVTEITDATASLSFDSPAMNTRRRATTRRHSIDSPVSRPNDQVAHPASPALSSRSDYALPPPPGSRSRKQRSIGSISSISNASADNSLNRSTQVSLNKRICRDMNVVSYSKPGPPTPARKGNRSINASDISLDSTSKSIASGNVPSVMVTDETPRRSLRNLHDKTPLLETTNLGNSSRGFSSKSIIKTPMSLHKVMCKAFRKKEDKYAVKESKRLTPLKASSALNKP